jgi:hypothetical protein
VKTAASAKAADSGFIFIPLLRAFFGNVERLCIVYDEYGPTNQFRRTPWHES